MSRFFEFVGILATVYIVLSLILALLLAYPI